MNNSGDFRRWLEEERDIPKAEANTSSWEAAAYKFPNEFMQFLALRKFAGYPLWPYTTVQREVCSTLEKRQEKT
jgi:hypothetical protein